MLASRNSVADHMLTSYFTGLDAAIRNVAAQPDEFSQMASDDTPSDHAIAQLGPDPDGRESPGPVDPVVLASPFHSDGHASISHGLTPSASGVNEPDVSIRLESKRQFQI